MFSAPLRLCVRLVCLLVLTAPASAQLVEAKWLAETERAVDAGRKTDVRVIVMDVTGRFVPGASVTVRQERSAFQWGVLMPESGPGALGGDAPVLRHLNAVSLEPVTRWPALQPVASARPTLTVATQMAEQARRQGLDVRWGPMVAGDPQRNPSWLLESSPADAEAALQRIVATALDATRGQVQAIDLLAQSPGHAFPTDRLGPGAVRRLYEQASAIAPEVRLALRFEDALVGPQRSHLAAAVTGLREDFVPFDEVAIEQIVLAKANRTPVQRAMEAIAALGYDVVIARLEVGGASAASAALNLETLLRVLFAEPAVKGVYFAGLRDSELAAPHAALLGEDGQPTLAGQVFDALATGWRTDAQVVTDELGNAHVRVFAGSQTFTATLPNGAVATTTVWIDKSPETRVIVLQPLRR